MRVCVFCGSSSGRGGRYVETAAALGRHLAGAGIGLVYGGARVGTMGAVADAALDAGGEVVGVLPASLEDAEIPHRGLTQLHVVDGLHERKAMMADRADAFVALPGGLGTLEELFEVWTWATLGLHRKPLAVLDVDGIFEPLITLVDHLVEEGFVRPHNRALLAVHTEVPALLDDLARRVGAGAGT